MRALLVWSMVLLSLTCIGASDGDSDVAYRRALAEIQAAASYASPGSAAARSQIVRLEELIEEIRRDGKRSTLAHAFSILSNARLLEGDREGSAVALEQSFDATKQAYGESDRRTLSVMAEAGQRWTSAGRGDRSERLWREYLARAIEKYAKNESLSDPAEGGRVWRGGVGEAESTISRGYLGLAKALQLKKDYGGAEQYFLKTIEVAGDASGQMIVWEALKGRSEVLEALGRRDDAREVRAKADSMERSWRSPTGEKGEVVTP